jgi:DNA-binding CsgD family transcriptional regulator/sugar-specific transcriptional regulator TrmB
MLESLGLSAAAEAVYRTMLAHRSWGRQQIADHLGISTSQMRSVLDQLAELALLQPSQNSPGGWRPVDPSVGLAALLARAEAEVLERRQRIDASRAAIAAIASEHVVVRDPDAGLRWDGIAAVRARMEELSATVVRECVSLNPNTAQTPDAQQASRPLDQQLLERGIVLRCVYQDSFRNDPDLVAYAHWLASLGSQARTVPVVPISMVVYDRRTVLLPIDPGDTTRGAMEIRSSGVAAMAYALFEQLWTAGVPFDQPTGPHDRALTATQRQLLQLLAAGHTDEFAARRLGVSLSTVRRLMATIMERLDARSRFQAGVHAAERGWFRLDGDPG